MAKISVYDFIIVGSGFGGSVCAMRLAEKGYKVLVLEKGKRWNPEDFPKTNWHLSKYLWLPVLRWYGIQKISILRGLMLLHGVGVGGGSLVYANTLMAPEDSVLASSVWPTYQGDPSNWLKEIKAYLNDARQFLGVRKNPHLNASEQALKKVASQLKCSDSFHPTEVAVYFDEDNQHEQLANGDPYFKGEGPTRKPCNQCGRCMIGCPERAKNTLDLNYLYFAEKAGAQIIPEMEVHQIVPTSNMEFRYRITTMSSTRTRLRTSSSESFYAKNVIVSAGVLGTLALLFKNKINLPNLSQTLGQNVRINGESLLGVVSSRTSADYSKGIAIGAAIHPDKNTKIETVRYPNGSGLMRMLAVPLTGPGNFITRPLKLFYKMVAEPKNTLRVLLQFNWAKHATILLAMQTTEQAMSIHAKKLFTKFGPTFLFGKWSKGQVPTYLPVAQEAASIYSEVTDGVPQNNLLEVLLDTPVTAHILGGACMAHNRDLGVVNESHEVFGHQGLYICDGSVIPLNLGVNPSLMITALSERFSAQFKSKADKLEH